MDLLILGSLLLTGGFFALAGLFEGDDDKDDREDTPPDDEHRGTEGDDMLGGDSGVFLGLHGDDQITVSGTAEGRGNQGNDTLTAEDHSSGFGGAGEDDLTADGFSTLYGGGGDDVLVSHSTEGGTFLHGDAGDDTLLGSTAGDMLNGGAGNDLLVITHSTTANEAGITVDVGEGNDTLLLDPNAVFASDADSGQNPILISNFSPNDKIIFGAETDDTLTGLNWVAGDEGAFTLYRHVGDENIATNLHVITTDGEAPFYDSWQAAQTDWAATPLDDLRDFSPDTVPLETSTKVGTIGADTLTSEPYAYDEVYGLDGNDVITDTGATAFGGSGDDLLNDKYASDQGSAYGDAGSDTIDGYYNSYGGSGNDDITTSATGSDVVHIGHAYGGEGDDTLHSVGTFDGGGMLAGEAGDDVIFGYAGDNVSAGSGDDTVILTGYTEADSLTIAASHVALGSGADILAIDANLNAAHSAISATSGTTISDFDIVEGDQIGIILPTADQAALSINVVPDPSGSHTDIVISLPGGGADQLVQTYRLQGVASFDPADIQLYENEAAVQAGTPYGHL
ncbi:hypothetical protein [Cypionkella sp.]|uniref:hypothetical protein n=1 Tax=Cypionkella sp. TaxID=2811411 RepID=UPI00261961F7|nr:hypothetical protein [Cypionkella sp.]MDB5665199.1 hypothetical protein [Cypionkella sp.]